MQHDVMFCYHGDIMISIDEFKTILNCSCTIININYSGIENHKEERKIIKKDCYSA